FGGGMLGQMFQRIALSERLGAYMVESNQGHIGDNVDPRAGEDPGLYGWRASAESARFSKFVAAQVYGKAPHHAYIYGGSGGGRRSPMCLENAPDVYDGCMPSTSGGEIAEPGNNRSEERRVGKEGRARWAPGRDKEARHARRDEVS